MTSLIKKLALSTLLLIATHSASALTFNDFSNLSNLTLNGNAARHHSVLRLTPALGGQDGSAFSKTALNAAKFSSFFKFRISKRGVTGADGFVFVIQAISPNAIGYAGGDLGYSGIANSIGIEFDTYYNGEHNDINANHIGIDINGSVNHDGTLPVKRVFPSLSNGQIWYVWLDYDGTKLEVRLSPTETRPTQAKLKAKLNIPQILGNVNNAYVGFTAATGGSWENHDILAWEYREDYQPIGLSSIIDTMQTTQVICKNINTVQTIEIPAANINALNCKEAGLVGKQGDTAVVIISGKLK
ncbi:MAG: L-type lectin-domain containing protein [Methylococcaceae bacterium]